MDIDKEMLTFPGTKTTYSYGMSENQTDINTVDTTTERGIVDQYHNASVQNGSLSTQREFILNDQIIQSIIISANEKVFDSVFLPSLVYLVVLLVIGLPGNALVCILYHNKISRTSNRRTAAYVRKSSDIFILALAWLDVLNCVLSVPVEIFLVRYFLRFDHQWICKVSRFFAMVLNAASSFVLIGIATDRFIGIKYSHSSYRFTDKTAIKFVAGSVILALAVSWPGLILYGTMSIPLTPNIIAKTCLIQDKYMTTSYPLIVSTFLLSMHLLFDLFFIIIYSVIGKEIVMNKHVSSFQSKTKSKHHDQGSISSTEISSIAYNTDGERSPSDKNSTRNVSLTSIKSISIVDSSNRSRSGSIYSRRNTKRFSECSGRDSAVHGRVFQASKTTFILFAVTLVFMLTFAPYCAIAIIRNVSSADFYPKLSDTEKALYQVFLRSYLLSSSVNPLIYCFLSRKFRQDVKTMFLKTVR